MANKESMHHFLYILITSIHTQNSFETLFQAYLGWLAAAFYPRNLLSVRIYVKDQPIEKLHEPPVTT